MGMIFEHLFALYSALIVYLSFWGSLKYIWIIPVFYVVALYMIKKIFGGGEEIFRAI